jgi:hypothetical protein
LVEIEESRCTMHIRTLTTVAVLAVTLAGAAQAQHRKGFWIGFGIGPGWTFSYGPNNLTYKWSSAYLRMGGTVSSKVRLGGESLGGSDGEQTWANGTFMAQYFPLGAIDLYAKVGAGLGVVEARRTVDEDTEQVTTKSSFGLTLGTGWEIPVGSVGTNVGVDWMLQTRESLETRSGTHTIWMATVGIVFP